MNKQVKQLAIIGVLGAVLLAVGAFQFMTPVPVPPLPDNLKDSAEGKTEPTGEEPVEAGGTPAVKNDPIREALLTYATSSATPRDPFKPSGDLAKEYSSPQGKVAPAGAAPVVGNPNEGAKAPSQPAPRQNVPPMDPMQGHLASGSEMGLAPTGLASGGPIGPGAGNPSAFAGGPSYKVKGIIVGNTRMVVLEDSEGNQKLVPEGGSVDGDTTIVKVRDNAVKISTRGRRKDVPLEEENR